MTTRSVWADTGTTVSTSDIVHPRDSAGRIDNVVVAYRPGNAASERHDLPERQQMTGMPQDVLAGHP